MHDGSAFLKFDYDDNTDSMKLYVEVAWFTFISGEFLRNHHITQGFPPYRKLFRHFNAQTCVTEKNVIDAVIQIADV